MAHSIGERATWLGFHGIHNIVCAISIKKMKLQLGKPVEPGSSSHRFSSLAARRCERDDNFRFMRSFSPSNRSYSRSIARTCVTSANTRSSVWLLATTLASR